MANKRTFDVLVVGSGIAGTAAAMAASEERPDANIAIASFAPLFSGSSFAPTTWLLGLISPGKTQAGQDDLARRIREVGGGLANDAMVREFAAGIEDSVLRAESWGVEFLEPSADASHEKEYIACFDDTMRHWRGLVRSSWRKALGPKLENRGITALEGCELLDLRVCADGSSVATFFSHKDEAFFQTRQAAIVLATGGTANLWPGTIAGSDAQATVHAIAANIGATCTNMASMQFMPTIVSPIDNVVFNEKAFRFMEFPAQAVREIEEALPRGLTFEDALDERSGYGPYSARLASNAIDYAICAAGKDGLALTPRIGADAPELVRRYLSWLSSEHGVSADAPVRVALRAQASNGGIAIGADGSVGAPGVFAAGECTGGMHGADRIGGLSSANALTFGIRAGQAAAHYGDRLAGFRDSCRDDSSRGYLEESFGDQICATQDGSDRLVRPECTSRRDSEQIAWSKRATKCRKEVESELKDIMASAFGPVRDEARMKEGACKLAALAERLSSLDKFESVGGLASPDELTFMGESASYLREIALIRRTALRVKTAQMVAQAALLL